MCEFCKDYNRHIAYRVPVRNTYADDNLCEILMDDNCEDCDGCMDENYHFTLYKWQDMISFGLVRKIGDAICAPTSEGIMINYCPWCGKKLHNNEDYTFDKCCVDKLVKTER